MKKFVLLFALALAAKSADYTFAMRRPEMSVYEPLTLADREALAIGYAQKALSIDPNLGLVHFSLALMHRNNWEGSEALEAFERAHQLSPNDVDILDDYSRTLSFVGYHEDAIARAEPRDAPP